MKDDVSTSPVAPVASPNGGEWLIPDLSEPFSDGPGRTAKDFDDYRRLLTQIIDIADAYGWSRTEFAQRIGMPSGTFSQWASKKYPGRYDTGNAKVQAWLDVHADVRGMEARLPKPPAFMRLDVTVDMMELFTAAQIMPKMVVATAAAGVGKTLASEHYFRTRANVFMSTMSPMTRTYTAMLAQIAEDIGITQPVRGRSLMSQIGDKLARTHGGTLLIIDEAQHLDDQAINQLRVFFDKYRCGIALVGNTETFARSEGWLKGTKTGQLHRRIFKQLHVMVPYAQDLRAFIGAWGVSDPKSVEFLMGIGTKPGALGQINETIEQALMVAGNDIKALTCRQLEKAWENRRIGGLK